MELDEARQKLQECSCGVVEFPRIQILHEGTHWAKMECSKCGKFFDWIRKPESTSRPSKHKNLRKYTGDYCQMCLIKKEYVPHSESLSAHHVVEYNDGGEATKENTWTLCTACHSLLHWRRTYVKHLVGNGVVEG